MLYFLILLSFFVYSSETTTVNVLCSSKFCEEYLKNASTNPCIVQDICKDPEAERNILIVPSIVPCDCCENCLQKLELGDHCDVGELGGPNADSICGDDLYCDQENRVCVPISTPCAEAQKKFDKEKEEGTLGHTENRPNCNEHGIFEPYVCISNEVCYCVNEDGVRIFGTVPFTTLAKFTLKCGCSRTFEKAKSLFGDDFHIPDHFRCQSNGDYDAIQCLNEENCYCVDSEDGVPTFPNIPSVPMENITNGVLPCLDSAHKVEEYYKPCEKIYKRQLNEVREFTSKGIEVLGFRFPNCQIDGFYAAVQENKTHKFCVHPNGTQILNFILSLDDPLAVDMNCNCARVITLIQDEIALDLPKCLENGDYDKIQCRRGLCRCVDQNGYQTEKEVLLENVESLPCFVSITTPIPTTTTIQSTQTTTIIEE